MKLAPVALGGAVILTLAAGVATAATSTTAGAKACENTHRVLTVMTHGKCAAGSHRVTLGAKGPRGRRGATGKQGPRGLTGSGTPGAPGALLFATAGNFQYTAPTGVTAIIVEAAGGGGGGSGVQESSSGGSGGQIRALVPVTPGDTYQITVGGGGSGGTFAGGAAPGGATTFSDSTNTTTYVTAEGGGAGQDSGNPAPGGDEETSDVAGGAKVLQVTPGVTSIAGSPDGCGGTDFNVVGNGGSCQGGGQGNDGSPGFLSITPG